MKAPMFVDMKEMVREGRFGWIDAALTREELIGLLGQPEMWGHESDLFIADVWRYGSIEFHFDGVGSGSAIYIEYSAFGREFDVLGDQGVESIAPVGRYKEIVSVSQFFLVTHIVWFQLETDIIA